MKIDSFKIKLLLAEQGITQAVLAERCGISRQNVSAMLGRGSCSIATVGKLAKGLGVEIQEIIKEE